MSKDDDKRVTKLEDARISKLLKVPLDTKYVDTELSPEFLAHWEAMWIAHRRFMKALEAYSGGRRARSLSKWKMFKRRLDELETAVLNAGNFARTLCGGSMEKPVFKRQQDEHEFGFLTMMLAERAVPYIKFWIDAADQTEKAGADGEGFQISTDDIPPWLDFEGVMRG